jgi:hypothetical protein
VNDRLAIMSYDFSEPQNEPQFRPQFQDLTAAFRCSKEFISQKVSFPPQKRDPTPQQAGWWDEIRTAAPWNHTRL